MSSGTVSSKNLTSLYSNTTDFTSGVVNSSVYSVNGGTGVTVSPTTGNVLVSIGQDVATTANPTFAGATLGNVTVGVDSNQTISTSSGNLVLKSTGGEIDTDDTTIISTNSNSFLLLNFPTTVTAFDSATTLTMGETTGNTFIRNTLNTPGADIGNITIGIADDNTITTTSGDLVITAINPNAVNISSGTTEPTRITRNTTTTNTGVRGLTLNVQSSGTPAVGFGNSLEYEIETAVGNTERAGYVAVISEDLTPGSEEFRMIFGLMTAGVAADTKMALSNTGDLTLDGGIRLSGSTSGSSIFSAPATGSVLSYVLPGTAGAANTVLTNNGSGTLTWALPGGGGSTFGNITVGVVTDNTISTTTGDLDITATGNNGVNITSGTDEPTKITRNSTTTASSIRSLALNVQSSGTPTAGFGNNLEWQLETAPGNTESAGFISVVSTDVTPTAEDFKMSFGLMQNGLAYTEKASLSSAGNLVLDGDLTVNSAITNSLGDLDITAVGNNTVNITSGSDGPTLITRNSSTTNTNIRSLGLNSQSSGTPATGIGNSIEFNVETAPSITTAGGYLSVTSTDITPGSEDFKMSFGLMAAGATYAEKAFIDSTGNMTLDGGLTATSVAVPYDGASSLVGSLNVGGAQNGSADIGIIASFVGASPTYAYTALQNKTTSAASYGAYALNNDLGTVYGELGMTSSTYNYVSAGFPNNAFSTPNTTFLQAGSGSELTIGTNGSNSIHFITNGGTQTTEAMTINPSNAVAFAGAFGTSGQALISGGNASNPTWQTVTSANTPSTIVARDASGNFSASGATLGNVTVGVDSAQTISTTSGNLVLQTAAGVNAGTITLFAGVDGTIAIAPNGTGDIHLNSDAIRIGDANATATLATRGTGNLVLTTNEGSGVEGTLTFANGANGNATFAPNGTGSVVNTFSNGGNLTNNRNYVLGAIRNATTQTTNGDIWELNTSAAQSQTNPYFRGVSLDNSADTTRGPATLMRSYSGGAVGGSAQRGRVVFEKARGTAASPTAVQANDVLGSVDVTGYTSTGWLNDTIPAVTGFFGFTATENYVSNTALGTQFNLSLAPTATTISTGANLVPVLALSPQTATYRSDTHTFQQGKTGTTTYMDMTVNRASFSVPIRFPNYTVATLTGASPTLVGAVGWQVAVSDSPTYAGRMAYWSTTATAGWRYVDDNTAV